MGFGTEYVPLTESEVLSWLSTVKLGEVITFIIIADDWDNSEPNLQFPNVYAILDDNGTLYIRYDGPIQMSVGTVDPLKYKVHIQNMILEDFYAEERKPKWPWFAVGGGCIVGGFILGILVR